MSNDSTQQIIQSLEKPFAELLEIYRQMEGDQKTITNRQGLIKKAFSDELKPIQKALDEVFERLDAIERTIHQDDWARRTEGSNG